MGNRYRRSGGSCSHTTDSDPARSTQRVQGAGALSRVLWKSSPTEPKGYFSDLAPSRRCSALAWWHRSLEATEGSSDGADIRDGFSRIQRFATSQSYVCPEAVTAKGTQLKIRKYKYELSGKDALSAVEERILKITYMSLFTRNFFAAQSTGRCGGIQEMSENSVEFQDEELMRYFGVDSV